MSMKSVLILVVFGLLLTACKQKPPVENPKEKWTNYDPIVYVNPYVGTANNGNTFPGASVPWGMAHIAPHNTRERGWSGSRYFFARTFLYGFGQIHLSGVGCGDFANINLMPTTGKVYGDFHKNRSRYGNENAMPGFYDVFLASHGIRARLSATKRATICSFTYPECQGDANLIIDLTEGLSQSTDAGARIVNGYEVEGWNTAGGFCQEENQYTIYFVSRFSKKAKTYGTFQERSLMPGSTKVKGDKSGVYFSFDTDEGEEIIVRTGLSFVSIANARENLEKEIPHEDFNRVVEEAQNAWNLELSRIEVKGSDADKIKFYTALYHALIHPNIIDDVNGEYTAMKTKEIRKVNGRNQYTVFSLWDTYRSLHPLLTLMYPERQTAMLQTMADHVETGGELPFWELGADETYVMNGDPAPIVVADSYIKGLHDFDINLVFKAMLASAFDTVNNRVRPMQAYFSRYGFIPYDDCGPDDRWGKRRMVSECLEYAFADWAIAQIANKLEKKDTARMLEERSKAYRYFYDPDTGFFRPRNRDMSWFSPFYPDSWNGSWKNPGFVEGNSWQYSFFVPHDVSGLTKLMGGEEAYVAKLQRCFDEKHFAIDNEPDIAYPYLFTYFPGQAWRTQEIVRRLMDEEFHNHAGGLPGNDDAGTISAWLLFSAMGFYPDCPGTTRYSLGSPLFSEITLHLNNDFWEGKEFKIKAINNSPQNIYIARATLNGKPLNRDYLLHEEIVKGGELVLEMSDSPLK